VLQINWIVLTEDFSDFACFSLRDVETVFFQIKSYFKKSYESILSLKHHWPKQFFIQFQHTTICSHKEFRPLTFLLWLHRPCGLMPIPGGAAGQSADLYTPAEGSD
jgi:hypothetical protein